MRSRVLLPVLLLAVIFVPQFVHAAIPFFGPIIAPNLPDCPLGWGAVMIVVNNIIELALTIAIVFFAPLMLAYAGFLFVVNPVNPAGKEKAKKILTNTISGIVIALAAWLIIDALLVGLTGSGVSTWTQLISGTGADLCLKTNGTNGTITGSGVTPIGNVPLSTNANCTPSSIQSAAAKSGYTLTDGQAQALSCISTYESGCSNNASGATTPNGTPSYALGVFQIVPGYSDACHSLNIPVCSQAAGVTGNLNCSSVFSCKNQVCTVKSGFESQWAACQRAGANFDCNAAAAACLVKATNGLSPWATEAPGRGDNQRACIAQYAGS